MHAHRRARSLSTLMDMEEPPPYPDQAVEAALQSQSIRGSPEPLASAPHAMEMQNFNITFGPEPSAPLLPAAMAHMQQAPTYQSHTLPPVLPTHSQGAVPRQSNYHPRVDPPPPPLVPPASPLVPAPTPLQPHPAVGDRTQPQYYSVFFQPDSQKLFVNVDGFYHALPQQFSDFPLQPTMTVVQAPPMVHNVPHQHPEVPPKDHYQLTLIMITLFILCLDLPMLFLCLLPALVYAKKARTAKRSRLYDLAAQHGMKARNFNICGGICHALLIIGIIITGVFLLLHFAFDVFVDD